LNIPFHKWLDFINDKLNSQYEQRKNEEKLKDVKRKMETIEEEKERKKDKKDGKSKKKSIFGIFPF